MECSLDGHAAGGRSRHVKVPPAPDRPAQVLGLGSLQGGVAGVGFSALNKGAYVVAVDSSKDKVLHTAACCVQV